VTCCPTTGPRTAGAIVREQIARGADLILAAGGDGTLNEVAEGMAHSEVPLGVLPAGTANVLAMEMKLGGDFLGAARRLGECRPQRISIGQVISGSGATARHFLLMAGIGLDAQIVYHVNAPLKARIGKLAYWLAGWSLLGRNLPEFSIEADGVTHRCSFALVSKVRNYGGDFEIARDVSLFDDEFELVLFKGRSTLRYVRYFAGVVTRRIEGIPGIVTLRARRVSAPKSQDGRVFVQIDGEYAGHLPAEIRIVPDALTLLVPPEYHPKLQQQRAELCQG
jgi:diacylglycerol kinase family enzyme